MKFDQIKQNVSLSRSAPGGSPTFGGFSAKIPSDINELKIIKRIVDCKANNLVSDTIKRVPLKYLTQKGTDAENILLPAIVPKWRELLESFVDIARIPRGIATSAIQNLYEKFPKNKLVERLNSRPFVQKHIQITNLKDDLGILRGVYENGTEFLRKAEKSTKACEYGIKEVTCESVSNGFDRLLNDAMGWGKPRYDTKHERFWARLISGFTAANFLGRDFYNKAKMNNKNDKEAKQSAGEKINQERLAAVGEAVSQFAFLATFAQLANTKTWVAPVVSASIGFAFNIISRLVLGRKLTRVKTSSVAIQFGTTPKIEDFVQRAKDGQEQNNVDIPSRDKKHRLSLKNILIATGASIAAGFVFKAGAKTKAFQNLKDAFAKTPFGAYAKKLESNAFKDVITDRKELQELGSFLNRTGEGNIGSIIKKNTSNFTQGRRIYAGRCIKTTKLFGKIEVPVARLQELPLIPLRFFKELIMYPYKMVDSLVQASAKNILEKRGIDLETVKVKDIEGGLLKFCAKLIDDSKPARKPDIADIENILLKFRSFKNKYPKVDDFQREFGEYLKTMRKISVNSTTASKINNEKLAVPAQILGMLSGIVFNMNDDYNQTIELGGSKKQAQKDARLRGVNKFIRVAVQATIVGTLNTMLVKYYNTSLLKAALITAGSTIATDTGCRVLTGMPFRKMNKKELIEQNKRKEKGISGKYFKMINKIVS